MKKSIKRRYRIKKKTVKNRTRKNRTRKNRRSKSSRARSSPTASTVMEDCCMCESRFDKNSALIPQECLMKYGKIRAHKVCPSCWWGEFAKEGVSHKCPGCVKGLPVAKDVDAGKVIDLTEDIVEAVEDGLEEEV